MPSIDLELPYTTLVEVVRSFELRGRVCYGALLKPQLLKALGEGVSERTLGFRRFGDFLRAAQSAGRIQLIAHVGGDLEAKLPREQPRQLNLSGFPVRSAATPMPPSASEVQQPLRVRPDLWRAFNATSVGWYFDKSRDIATRIPTAGPRQAGDDLVPVPSARPRLPSWMKSFAELQESATRDRLLTRLETETNPFAFELLLRSNPSLLRAWRGYHVQQVISEIQVWANANGLRPKNVAVPFQIGRVANSSISQGGPAVCPPLVAVPTSRGLPAANTTEYVQDRLPLLIDGLIDQLITLRGLIAVSAISRKTSN